MIIIPGYLQLSIICKIVYVKEGLIAKRILEYENVNIETIETYRKENDV